jgi:hypothetical protein
MSNQLIEFKDKEGKVVLKKVQLIATDNGSGSPHAGWMCTYYIYDKLGQLRCVIQPKATEALTGNWVLNTDQLNELCFRYEYDNRGRMIIKKVPGAGEVYMVYDGRDRLVLMQDANMREVTTKWMYTRYDKLNRPIETGLWTNSDTWSIHADAAAVATQSGQDYPNLSGQTVEVLTEAFYDNYNWLSTSPHNSTLSNQAHKSYHSHLLPSSNTLYPYPQPFNESYAVRGIITGTRVKVLGTSTYLYSVNFYDDKGRLIQVESINNTGEVDIATTQYSFNGQPLLSIHKLHKGAPNAQTTVVVTNITYDDLGRVIKTR